MMNTTSHPAPEFEVSAWLNAPGPVTLAAQRGKVVAVYAFQMLCPGCVSHAIPQAKELGRHFGRDELSVLGLHTVFEHHEAMNERALAAFLHEYRVEFPVGVDRPSQAGPIPSTMSRYRMRGTPTLLLFDRQGVLRHSLFGHLPDLQVGALIGGLLAEAPADQGCDADGCRIPQFN
jgi:peroxiredoxin